MVAHEYAHAEAAYRQGDDTAYMLGRLTMNPLKHIDPFLTILLPVFLWWQSHGAFVFGGAKPVPVNPRKYVRYVRGDIIVSLAGIATNLVLFVAFSMAFAGCSAAWGAWRRGRGRGGAALADPASGLGPRVAGRGRRLLRRAGAVRRAARSAAAPDSGGRS